MSEELYNGHHDSGPFEPDPEILLQPETRPISHEQLMFEVRDIYKGLVTDEARCITADKRQLMAIQEQDPTRRVNLEDKHWRSLVALYKRLLHDHYNFILASQHPSASDALIRTADNYNIPARMWRHGIQNVLDILLHGLPNRWNIS